jgi:hypothetical protein
MTQQTNRMSGKEVRKKEKKKKGKNYAVDSAALAAIPNATNFLIVALFSIWKIKENTKSQTTRIFRHRG